MNGRSCLAWVEIAMRTDLTDICIYLLDFVSFETINNKGGQDSGY